MINEAETSNPGLRCLYGVGGVAALATLLLFLIGLVGVISAGTRWTFENGWLAPFQNNWLVVLFKLNAGLSDVQADSLNVRNLLDIAIMGLFCPVFLALYMALRRISAALTLVAVSLPFLSIPVFLITGMAGRSGLLLSGLIMSAVVLRSSAFGKPIAYMGIAAGALLLFGGDLATAIFTPSSAIAVLIGTGYVLWIVWFGMVARRLFQLARSVSKEEMQHKTRSISAARMVAAVFGVFGGLLGLEHGYYEILQGNFAPTGFVISAIGPPCQAAMAQNGCEPAISVVPNFLITGILAIVVSLTIIVWATILVQKRRGGAVLVTLGLILLLVGGGFTPIPFVIIAGFAGTGAKATPVWWQAHLAPGVERTLARLWPRLFLMSVAWYVGLQVLGSLFHEPATALGALGLVLTLLAALTGFAYDGRRQRCSTDLHLIDRRSGRP